MSLGTPDVTTLEYCCTTLSPLIKVLQRDKMLTGANIVDITD